MQLSPPAPDPFKRREFVGEEEEIDVITNYHKALFDLRRLRPASQTQSGAAADEADQGDEPATKKRARGRGGRGRGCGDAD